MSRSEPATAQQQRLLPAAVAAWGSSWAATGQQPWLVGLLAVVLTSVVAMALLVRRCRSRGLSGSLLPGPAIRTRLLGQLVVLALVIAVFGGLGLVRSATLHGSAVARLAEEQAVVAAVVTVSADPRLVTGSFGDQVLVAGKVAEVIGRGARHRTGVSVLLIGDPETLGSAQVGSRWRIDGQLTPPDPGADIAARFRVHTAEQVAAPGSGWQLIDRVRAGLRESVAQRPAGPRALVPALVVGDISGIAPELRDIFVTTGLTHLTAVSGANLTLMLAFVLVLARWAGVRGRWLTVAGLCTVAAFVALCRTEPSVLRATAMGLVALAAVGRSGGPRAGTGRGMRHLCVAVIALLAVDPWLGRSVGFALSTLATGGILVWAGRWAGRMKWSPRVVAEAVAVPLAAQLATQPVVSAISGQVSAVGLLANALAGPLVGPATVAGFAAAGLSLIHPVPAQLAGWLASWPAQGIIWVAELTGRLPGAAFAVPTTPSVIALITVVSVLAAWGMGWVLSRRLACLAGAVVLMIALVRAPVMPGWPPDTWQLVMCDIGQGDAAVVRVAPASAVVVDTGPDPAGVDRCLDQLGISEVALLVLSHYHSDHIGGLEGVWQGREVGLVITTPAAIPAYAARQVAAQISAHGSEQRVTAAGDVISIGAAQWETLWPTAREAVRLSEQIGDHGAEGVESATENDASVVGRLTTAEGITILFPGDLEPTGQRKLLASGVDPRAMVLKVPHHGSRRQDPEFLTASGARWAVTSSGEDNSYGHPAPATVRLLERAGMTVLRTDTSGAVALGVAEGHWVVRTQR